MIQVSAIDVSPAEVELLQQAAHLLEARLFPKKTNKKFQFAVELTRQPYRQPISRDQLVGRSGLSYKPPKKFNAVVSLAGGLSDAIETLAHELIHIAQVRAGRLKITRKKIRKQKITLHRAKWLKEKPVMIDEVMWQQRPWEIEACRWQVLLRDDVVALMSGLPRDLLTQKGKTELGLYTAPLLAPLQQVAGSAPQAMPQATPQHMQPQHMQPQHMPPETMSSPPSDSGASQPVPVPVHVPEPVPEPAPVPVPAAVVASQPANNMPSPAQPEMPQKPAYPTAAVVRAVAPAASPLATSPPAAPDVTTPDVTAPEVTAPEPAAPEVTAPDVTAPEVPPEIKAPDMTAPEMTAPEMTAPEMAAPVMQDEPTDPPQPALPSEENLVADLGVDLSAVGFGAPATPATSADAGQPESAVEANPEAETSADMNPPLPVEEPADEVEEMAVLEKPEPVEASIEDDALVAELMSGDIDQAAPMEIAAMPVAEEPESADTQPVDTLPAETQPAEINPSDTDDALADIAASVAAAMPSDTMPLSDDGLAPDVSDDAGDQISDLVSGPVSDPVSDLVSGPVSVPGTGSDPFGPVPDLGALDSVVVAGDTKFDVPRQIYVEGLGETRTLNADSLQSKLDELKQRGLVLDEDVKRAKESAEPS
ncbi:MAG: hypothetical protein ACON4F_08500 [Candidatus Puniceispirillaceae bacterium]